MTQEQEAAFLEKAQQALDEVRAFIKDVQKQTVVPQALLDAVAAFAESLEGAK